MSRPHIFVLAASVSLLPAQGRAEPILTALASVDLPGFSITTNCEEQSSDAPVAAAACTGQDSGETEHFGTNISDAVATALATQNALGALVAVTSSGGFSSPFPGITAGASASSTDEVVLVGGSGSAWVNLTGTFSASVTGTNRSDAWPDATFIIHFVEGTYEMKIEGVPVAAGCRTGLGECSVGFWTEFGTPWFLTQMLVVSAGGAFGGPGKEFAVSIDGLDTAAITGVSIYDADMNALRDARLVSTNGFEYPAATVPEPGTLLLLSSGIALVHARRKRRLSAMRKGVAFAQGNANRTFVGHAADI